MLYHFSEEPDIEQFVPREKQNRKDFPAVVWAIDQMNQHSYFFPRNCPRIVLKRTPEISEEHRKMFFGMSQANKIIAIENRWVERVRNAAIYRYSFHDEGFELFDRTAGYYISHQTVKPLEVTPIHHLFDRLVESGVELRITPSLYPLRDTILGSTFREFGIHRFNHATDLNTTI